MKKPTKKPAGGGKRPPWLPDSIKLSSDAGGAGKTTNKPARKPDGKPAARTAPKSAASKNSPTPRKSGPRRSDPHAAREAQRYENPIVSREALAAFLSDSSGPLTAEEIARSLKLTAPDRFEALSRRLNAMLRDGQLLMNRRGGFAAAEQLDLIAGTVIAHPDGFGFLKPDKGGGDDLFLPPGEMRKALHGDRVLGSVTNVDQKGRREGAIVEVLERRLTRIVGRYSERAGIGTVVPDDRRITNELLIPPDARNGARDGQLVVCELIL